MDTGRNWKRKFKKQPFWKLAQLFNFFFFFFNLVQAQAVFFKAGSKKQKI